MPWKLLRSDEYEEWELVIPADRLYNLWQADGSEVQADGEAHEGVEWVLDFSRMVGDGGEIQSKRFVTTEALAGNEARSWAREIAAAWCLGLAA